MVNFLRKLKTFNTQAYGSRTLNRVDPVASFTLESSEMLFYVCVYIYSKMFWKIEEDQVIQIDKTSQCRSGCTTEKETLRMGDAPESVIPSSQL